MCCLTDPTPILLQEKFCKYIDFAKSIVRALPPEEIPTDLTDAHMLYKVSYMLDGFYDQLGEEDLRDAMGVVSGVAKVMDESVMQERHAIHSFCFLPSNSVVCCARRHFCWRLCVYWHASRASTPHQAK